MPIRQPPDKLIELVPTDGVGPSIFIKEDDVYPVSTLVVDLLVLSVQKPSVSILVEGRPYDYRFVFPKFYAATVSGNSTVWKEVPAPDVPAKVFHHVVGVVAKVCPHNAVAFLWSRRKNPGMHPSHEIVDLWIKHQVSQRNEQSAYSVSHLPGAYKTGLALFDCEGTLLCSLGFNFHEIGGTPTWCDVSCEFIYPDSKGETREIKSIAQSPETLQYYLSNVWGTYFQPAIERARAVC